jgi:hypothetical protein
VCPLFSACPPVGWGYNHTAVTRLPKPPPFAPEWRVAARLLRPGVEDCRKMLRELVGVLGSIEAVAEFAGFPVPTLRKWCQHRNTPNVAAVRAIWLIWVYLLHPEKLQTAFDLVTWGTFRPLQVHPPRSPAHSFMRIAEPANMDGEGI